MNVATFAAFVLALTPSVAWSQAATGTLTVNGASTPLTHVYAFWKDQQPFSRDLNLYVFLSDQPVTDDVLPPGDSSNAKLAELVRSNRIHAFELHFTDTGKTLDPGENGAIYHNGVAPARHGVSGFITYETVHLDGDVLEGRIRMDPDSVASAPFRITADFKITLPKKP